MRQLRILIAVLFLGIFHFTNTLKAEVALVVIEKNGSLSWNNFNAVTGATTSNSSLGTSKDVPIFGNWLGNGSSQIGVASFNKEAKQVFWQIVTSDNAIKQRVLGQKKDLIISGADFDGNGVADAAVARLKSGQVNWEIAYNIFTTEEASVVPQQFVFGGNGARIFYASPDGIKDWIGVVSATKKGKTLLLIKDLTTGEIHTSQRFPKWISKGQRPRPFPVKQANGSDILGFARTKGKSTQLHFRSLEGQLISNISVPGRGKVIVGDFNDAPGEEIAFKQSNKNTLYVVNPFNGFESEVSVQTGVAIDSFNIRALDTGFADDDTSKAPAPGENQGGNTVISGGAGKISCSNIVDIASLPDVLYKNENLHGGRGRTWLDQSHRMGGTRRLHVAGMNGEIFGCFGLWACDQPYGCRYYQQMCGDGKSNSQFAAAARANGGGGYAVVGTGHGTCYKFKADVGRYGNIRK